MPLLRFVQVGQYLRQVIKRGQSIDQPHEGFFKNGAGKAASQNAVHAFCASRFVFAPGNKKEASQQTILMRVSLRMVPETRIELVRVAPHAPQTCVSTISTTPALNVGKYIKKSLFSQAFSQKFMVLFSPGRCHHITSNPTFLPVTVKTAHLFML